MKEREPASIRVEWIKAHALPRHIGLGQTTEKDIWANGMADVAAGLAAKELGGKEEGAYKICKHLPPI